MSEYQPLDGKVAVVTGASRGIGQAIAQLLAERGADVMCGDLLEDQAEETAAAIAKQTGQRVTGVRHTGRRTAVGVHRQVGQQGTGRVRTKVGHPLAVQQDLERT